MPIDLPSAIRDALHADDISAEQLIQPTLRERAPHARGHRLFVAMAAVAVVAVIAVAGSVLASDHHGNHRQAGSDLMAGLVGYRWRVSSLEDGQGSMPVPASLQRRIGFTRDGYVLGDDTVNALQGNYRATSDGYSVRNGGGTLAGYAGDDVIRNRVIAAVDAMFLSVVPGAGQAPSAVIIVALHGDTLELHRNGIRLTLERAGTQPNFFAHPPSPTATPTA